MVVIRKHQARVIENHIALTFKGGHILADAIQATERNDLELSLGIMIRGRSRILVAFLTLALFSWGFAGAITRELRTLSFDIDVLVGAVLALALPALLGRGNATGLRALLGLIDLILWFFLGHIFLSFYTENADEAVNGLIGDGNKIVLLLCKYAYFFHD